MNKAVQSLIQIRCTISRTRRLIGWKCSQFVDPQPCASKPIEDNSPTNICRKKDFYLFSNSQKKNSYNLELGEMHKQYTTQSPVILLFTFIQTGMRYRKKGSRKQHGYTKIIRTFQALKQSWIRTFRKKKKVQQYRTLKVAAASDAISKFGFCI